MVTISSESINEKLLTSSTVGHVIVSQDFGGSVPEARRQQANWSKLIDFSRIKAFVNIAISPGFEWGARNIVLNAGLGGMRPNIAVLGFYNMDDLRHGQPLVDTTVPQESSVESKVIDLELPTDTCKTETMMDVTSYVTVLEDLLLRLQINVAIARGFQELVFPNQKDRDGNLKKYIDLWPIQMSAEITSEGDNKANLLTTNFDTCKFTLNIKTHHKNSRTNLLLKSDTLILQLGCILNTVPAWKKAYTLRVAVFVEYESDVEEERGRVKALLQNLRIEAQILVFWLASGDLPTYEVIVNGQSPGLDAEREVDDCLKNQDWWEEIQRIRGNRGETTASEDLAEVANVLNATATWPEASFQQGPRHERIERFLGLRKLLKRSKRRHTMSGITRLGVSLGMRTHRLDPQLMKEHPSNASASEDSGSSEESSDTDVFESDSDDNESQGRQSAASEGDIDGFNSDSSHELPNPAKITRRRSHGDRMCGPPPSRNLIGERKSKVPEPTKKSLAEQPSLQISPPDDVVAGTEEQDARPRTSDMASSKAASISNISNELAAFKDFPDRINEAGPTTPPVTPKRLEERFSALKNRPPPTPTSQRPAMSRHSSMPKFSSKPVPMTKVATEDGPGPSIMFTDTPSPPPRRNRLPSAYRPRDGGTELSDHISEASEDERNHSQLPSLSHRGSTYSTQSVPLSFNDLPCRAQHLILNELMRQNSADTAVMFTTLPSPLAGTSKSEETSMSYLSDLEVLCKGCPPCLLVHSNSMTVTMSL